VAGMLTGSALACSSGGEGDVDAGTGGAATGGSSSSGGESSTGGASPSGGETGSGGASGGETASGGESASGGETASGGSSSSSGCGEPGTTGVLEESIDIDGQARTFVLSVPESYDGETPLALVFAWHGLGGSGSLARLYFGVEQVADGAAIFVYPDGLPIAEQGDEPGWDLAADGIDVALFDQLLEELSGSYCIDSSRIFSIGHSYGGYMTNRLGCSRADVLRGVGPVAGGPPFGGGQSPCAGDIAAFLTHGTFDETVDIEQGIAARDGYLERSACGATAAAVDPAPCVRYDDCSSEDPVVWCEHDTPAEDAHGWPDFVAAGLWDFLSTLP